MPKYLLPTELAEQSVTYWCNQH